MDTQERAETHLTHARKRRALGLAAILVAAGVAAVMVMFITGGDDGPVAAADAAPRVVFDGDNCRYEGPAVIEAGSAEFTMVNASTEKFDVAGWRMPAARLDAELERFPLGANTAELGEMPAGTMALLSATEAGSESTSLRALTDGPHLIDCLTFEGGSHDHVWRAATIMEVVAP